MAGARWVSALLQPVHKGIKILSCTGKFNIKVTVLHLIFQSDNLAALLSRFKPDDTIVFFENATFCLMAGHALQDQISEAIQKNSQVFVLKEDVEARGLQYLLNGIQMIDYNGLVKLTEQHPVCKTWR